MRIAGTACLLAALLVAGAGTAAAQRQEPARPQFYSITIAPPGSEGRQPGFSGRATVTCLLSEAEQAVHEGPMHGPASNQFLQCRGPVRVTGLVWPTARPAEKTACTPLATHRPREGDWPAALNFVQWKSLSVDGDRVTCAMWAY